MDGDGKLYVTDFGLARIEADAGLTMTGDIIGTLRYMAPEQALAKRVVIDHRADVYSLGATLYELLTLQPAFGETDRSELLKQIAFEEPRPLRKLDRHIPAELETIVLKAMAKSPDERYQTAQRLADDLRANLEHRPIEAKPPTLTVRISKWSRRHVGVVRTAIAALVVVLAISFTSTGIVARWYREAAVQRLSADAERAVSDRERHRAEIMLADMQLKRGVGLLHEHQSLGLLDLADARITAGDHPIGLAAAQLWAIAIDDLKTPLIQSLPGSVDFDFDPEGVRLATAYGTTANIWDISSGRKQIGPLELGKDINTVAFSPDGKLIVAHSLQGVAQVWDAESGRPVSPPLRQELRPAENDFRQVLLPRSAQMERCWLWADSTAQFGLGEPRTGSRMQRQFCTINRCGE